MAKLHYDSEVQGRGRRFWFKTLRDAKAFDAAKRAAGYPTVRWERTVWVSFSKNITEQARLMAAGYDDWSI